MFLLTNKALGRNGEEQKEKPCNHHDYKARRAAIPNRLKTHNAGLASENDMGWAIDCFPTRIRV